MPPKVKYDPAAILAIAFDHVRQNGWEALSARHLADRIGGSVGPIYTHFKSMQGLQAAVVKKALDLFYAYVTQARTGDQWVDHGIGYVLFARDERHLFQMLFDPRYRHLRKPYDESVWLSLGSELADYAPFKDLSEGQIGLVRRALWVFVHGMATLLNAASLPLDDEAAITFSVAKAAKIFIQGIRDDPQTRAITKDDLRLVKTLLGA